MDKFTMETRLSSNSLDELIKELENKGANYPKVGLNIADRLADEMLKIDGMYKGTEKIPTTLEGNNAVSGIRNNEEKNTYQEFGTGIVGSQNPHTAEVLQQMGWKYDVNEHGEKGWWYPKGDGTFGWTKGQVAKKKFYEALQRAEEMFPEIGREELLKEARR